MPTGVLLRTISGLQGLWRMEGNFNDTSANAYNLTATNSPTVTTGKFGQGYDFEADSSQYAVIADASCPNLEISGSQTWMAWVHPESTGTAPEGNEIMIAAKAVSGFTQAHLFYLKNGSPKFTLVGLTTNNAVTHTGVAPLGGWSWVVGRYDATAGELSVWLNGVKVAVAAGGSAGDTNASFTIGRASDDATRYFDGVLDEVAIFNRAWSDNEILNYYAWASGKRLSSAV